MSNAASCLEDVDAATPRCPTCRRPLALGAGLVGRRIRCRGCGRVLAVHGGRAAHGQTLPRVVPAEAHRPTVCRDCGNRFHLPAGLAGRRIRCKVCAAEFVVTTPRAKPSPSPVLAPAAVPVAASRRAAGPSHEESTHHCGRSESSGQLLSWLAWLGGAAIVIGGLFSLASLLFSAGVLPQTRCLPEQCDWFASICWPKAAGGQLAGAAPGAELRALVQRCSIFLRNADLQTADVDSIAAGRAADGSGTIVVYRLAHPIDCEKIMRCPAFREIGQSAENKETIGGAAVFLLPASAIAFPDSRTIISGEKGLVRQVLNRWRPALRGPLEPFVRRLDFSAAGATAALGAPKALRDAHLRRRGELASAVLGTTEEIRGEKELEISRTLRFDSPPSAEDFCKTLRRSLADASRASGAADNVREALSKLEINAAGNQVVLKLRLPGGIDAASLRETIDSLF